jgi:indolepyruvate ferredoxin oxidoreductase alpha subunit
MKRSREGLPSAGMSKTEILDGERALAQGALEAGVSVAAGYPGSPSSGAFEALAALSRAEDLDLEWSANEKAALEAAIGASIAGRRALVCTKSVGFNVLLDPLMALNLTGVHGGLVILLGDDPGAYGSQNDQDTRPIAAASELPLLEPSAPAEARAMMRAAFELSERLRTAVVLRETRSFAASRGPVEVEAGPFPRPDLGLDRAPLRFVPYPGNAVALHRELHARLDAIESWAESAPFNAASGAGRLGVLACGFAWTKLLDVAGDAPGLRCFKLGTLFPLPRRRLVAFLGACERVLVLEENEPFVEGQLLALAHEEGLSCRILGKRRGHVAREGELFRWQIQEALEAFAPGFAPARAWSRERQAEEQPPREDHCAGCPYPEVLEEIERAARESGIETIVAGDPGCLVKAVRHLDAKLAMGSAAAIAQGFVRAGRRERAVAVFGDSSFFHLSLPAVIEAVWHRTPVLFVVLDNLATVTSGFQPNPGCGRDARGREAPRLSIEAIARACGVEAIWTVGPEDPSDALRAAFRSGLEHAGIAMVVVRKPCRREEGGRT